MPIATGVLLVLDSEQTELGNTDVHTDTSAGTTPLYLFPVYPSVVRFLFPVQHHRIPSSLLHSSEFITPFSGCEKPGLIVITQYIYSFVRSSYMHKVVSELLTRILQKHLLVRNIGLKCFLGQWS